MSTRKYIEITFHGYGTCLFETRAEADASLEGYEADEWSEKEVEMTPEEYEALPEFEG